MNLQEIINRPRHQAVHQEEMLYVIKEYIFERKGVDVNPEIQISFYVNRHLQLMFDAFEHAVLWYKTQLI